MFVESFDLGPADVLVVKVPVGAMPISRIKEYLEDVKLRFVEVFGDNQKIIMLPSKDEGGGAEIVIIKRTY